MDTINSPDGNYQYGKEVKLSHDYGVCLFITLNPDIRDDCQDSDSYRTLEKCKRYTERRGYGALWICNLFALRSAAFDELRANSDPIGFYNDYHIIGYAQKANLIMCAWGDGGAYMDRGKNVLNTLARYGLSHKIYDFGMTENHQPKPPLCVPDDQAEFHTDIKMVARPTDESCIVTSNRFLERAQALFDENDLTGALRSAWDAVEYYLKATAQNRGWAYRAYSDLYDISHDLSEETEDPRDASLKFGALSGAISSMELHDGRVSHHWVEHDIERAKSLLAMLENRTKPQPESRPSQKYRNGHMRGCGCDECRSLRTAMLKDIRKRRARRLITA